MAQNSSSLRAQDLRAIYLLLGECCELGADPLIWRRHLLSQLNRTFGAVASVDIEARMELAPGRPPSARVDVALTIDSFTKTEREILTRCMQRMRVEENALGSTLLDQSQKRGIVAGTRKELVDRSTWESCVFHVEYMAPLKWHDLMMSCDAQQRGFRNLVFSAQRGDHDFTVRSARMLELLTKELSAIPETRLAPLDGGSLLRMPRRLRQVAEGLGRGDTEQQIAVWLRITRSTAHEYVRRLYELFAVSSRGQLLTRLARQLHASELAEDFPSADCWYFRQTVS